MKFPSVPHELAFASPDLDMRVVHVEPDVATAACREQRPLVSTSRGRWPSEGVDEKLAGWVRDLGWLATGSPIVELGQTDVDALLDDCDSDFVDAPPRTDPAPRLRRLLRNAWCSSMANRDERSPSSISELATCLLLEDPSLDRTAVCRRLEISEGYLSRSFQRDLGVTFVAQRARIRVSRFTAHVEREGKNMLDAALTAGFGSYAQLYRTFCALVGMSPANYLRGGREARARLTRR